MPHSTRTSINRPPSLDVDTGKSVSAGQEQAVLLDWSAIPAGTVSKYAEDSAQFLALSFFTLAHIAHHFNAASEPAHDIYALTIAARLVSVAVRTRLRRLAAPSDSGIVIGKPHQPFAFDRS